MSTHNSASHASDSLPHMENLAFNALARTGPARDRRRGHPHILHPSGRLIDSGVDILASVAD